MRSQTSSNEMKTIIRDNFKKYWTVPALGLFLMLSWGFLPLILASNVSLEGIELLAMNESPGYVLGILILAVGAGMTVFSYLQNPSAANHIHSLPVSRSKLYAANVISGLLMCFIPVVINGLLMMALTGSVLFIKWIVVTAVACFAIFAITAFAATISGNTLMHLFNAAFFNGVFSLLLAVFYFICYVLLLGYEASDNWLTLLLHSNALFACIGGSVSWPLICIIYLAVGIAALILGSLSYQKRPIERTGNSLVFTWTRTLLFLLCIFSGAILSGLFFTEAMTESGAPGFDHYMVIGMIVGALIVYVVGSLMIDRSAKIFTKRNMLPAAIALVLAFAVSAGIGADVVGYTSYVPEASEVKAVYVDTTADNLFSTNDADGIYYGFRGNAEAYEKSDRPTAKSSDDFKLLGMTESDTIDIVRNLHQSAIDQDTSRGMVAGNLEIIYELNNGKTVKRSFKLYTTKEGEYTSADLDPAILNALSDFYNTKEFKDAYSVMNIRPEYFEKGVVTIYLCNNPYSSEEGISYVVPKKDLASLKKALDQDFRDSSFKDNMNCDGTIYCTTASMNEDEEYEEVCITFDQSDKHMKKWMADHQDVFK